MKKTKWEKVIDFAREIDDNAKIQEVRIEYLLGQLIERIRQAAGEEVNTEAIGFWTEPEDDDEEDDWRVKK